MAEVKHTDKKSTRPDKENAARIPSGECVCILDRLCLHQDFFFLGKFLLSNIWKRFGLIVDENMSDVSKESSEQESHSSENPGFLVYVNQTSCLENSEAVSSAASSDILCETEVVSPLTVCARSHSSFVESSSSLAASGVLLLPWFILCAAFIGCPKLLHHVLSTCEVRFKKESPTMRGNCNVPSSKAQAATHCGTHLKSSGFDSYGFPELSPLLMQPDLLTVYQLVNRRTACEFPITDTWVHQSVNLMISPLHMACWRHDFVSIVTLLQHGADPSGLALEQVSDTLRQDMVQVDSADTSHEKFIKLSDTLWFYRDRGLSPLHFIALGLRSPPRQSILRGCEIALVHDVCSLFQQFKERDFSSLASDNGLPCSSPYNSPPSVDCNQFFCVPQNSDPGSLNKKEQTAKCELIINCLDVLLHAEADPNLGQSVTLRGAYVLDIFLQPSSMIYYAPRAARGNQTSESLRLHDLELNASQVLAACNLLCRHNAQLSPTFLATYMWRPQLLDCFHLGNHDHARQLVRVLIQLGMFSEHILYDFGCGLGISLAPVSVFTNVSTRRFILDVMNSPIPANLAVLIFKWCSVNTLHDFIRAISEIAEMVCRNKKMRELLDMAISMQMRTLKHSCFYVTLSSVQFHFSKIWSLPLPVPLKRELTDLQI